MTADGGPGGLGDPAKLVEVRLLQLPVALWARAAEHADELMREFTLIAADARTDGASSVPARLVTLVEELSSMYGGFGAGPEDQLNRAAADGVESIDLVFRVPAEVGPAARHLGELLDEADEYCRRGQHLLTLATPADQRELRWWYLRQFVDPWPERERSATA
jgi:hypothetical protein